MIRNRGGLVGLLIAILALTGTLSACGSGGYTNAADYRPMDDYARVCHNGLGFRVPDTECMGMMRPGWGWGYPPIYGDNTYIGGYGTRVDSRYYAMPRNYNPSRTITGLSGTGGTISRTGYGSAVTGSSRSGSGSAVSRSSGNPYAKNSTSSPSGSQRGPSGSLGSSGSSSVTRGGLGVPSGSSSSSSGSKSSSGSSSSSSGSSSKGK